MSLKTKVQSPKSAPVAEVVSDLPAETKVVKGRRLVEREEKFVIIDDNSNPEPPTPIPGSANVPRETPEPEPEEGETWCAVCEEEIEDGDISIVKKGLGVCHQACICGHCGKPLPVYSDDPDASIIVNGREYHQDCAPAEQPITPAPGETFFDADDENWQFDDDDDAESAGTFLRCERLTDWHLDGREGSTAPKEWICNIDNPKRATAFDIIQKRINWEGIDPKLFTVCVRGTHYRNKVTPEHPAPKISSRTFRIARPPRAENNGEAAAPLPIAAQQPATRVDVVRDLLAEHEALAKLRGDRGRIVEQSPPKKSRFEELMEQAMLKKLERLFSDDEKPAIAASGAAPENRSGWVDAVDVIASAAERTGITEVLRGFARPLAVMGEAIVNAKLAELGGVPPSEPVSQEKFSRETFPDTQYPTPIPPMSARRQPENAPVVAPASSLDNRPQLTQGVGDRGQETGARENNSTPNPQPLTPELSELLAGVPAAFHGVARAGVEGLLNDILQAGIAYHASPDDEGDAQAVNQAVAACEASLGQIRRFFPAGEAMFQKLFGAIAEPVAIAGRPIEYSGFTDGQFVLWFRRLRPQIAQVEHYETFMQWVYDQAREKFFGVTQPVGPIEAAEDPALDLSVIENEGENNAEKRNTNSAA